jgi:hypothetical protein
MSLSSFIQKRLRLPSRIALLLGLGALSAAGARADGIETPPTGPVSHDGSTVTNLLVRAEAGRIYVSEGGQEIELMDTAQARLVMQLIVENGTSGPIGMQLKPTVLAGAGGSGFHWAPADKADTSGKPNSTAQRSTRKAVGTTAPQQKKNASPKAAPGISAQKE